MLSIKVPPLGESIVEATVSRWLKKEGDVVAAGDTLVDLETDKITVEVPALKPGVSGQAVEGEGEVVHVDDVLGELDETAVPADGRRDRRGSGRRRIRSGGSRSSCVRLHPLIDSGAPCVTAVSPAAGTNQSAGHEIVSRLRERSPMSAGSISPPSPGTGAWRCRVEARRARGADTASIRVHSAAQRKRRGAGRA